VVRWNNNLLEELWSCQFARPRCRLYQDGDMQGQIDLPIASSEKNSKCLCKIWRSCPSRVSRLMRYESCIHNCRLSHSDGIAFTPEKRTASACLALIRIDKCFCLSMNQSEGGHHLSSLNGSLDQSDMSRTALALSIVKLKTTHVVSRSSSLTASFGAGGFLLWTVGEICV
jgi:hypothetical protein